MIQKRINEGMEIINIIPSGSKLWEQAWRLYTESFPEYERRRISSHARAVEDPRFHTKVAVENGNLMAILFYWTLGEDRIYIEHIAVNPSMRGKNIGSTILQNFTSRNQDSTIILEIDPPVDEISKKRLSFYEKAGFANTGFVFNHPSFEKKGQEHDLVILSYPKAISKDEFDDFTTTVLGDVLKYID